MPKTTNIGKTWFNTDLFSRWCQDRVKLKESLGKIARKKLGVSYAMFYYLRARNREPSLTFVARLAAYSGIPIDQWVIPRNDIDPTNDIHQEKRGRVHHFGNSTPVIPKKTKGIAGKVDRSVRERVLRPRKRKAVLAPDAVPVPVPFPVPDKKG